MVPPAQKSKADVWAQLLLAEADCRRVSDFFTTEIGVHPKYVVRRMHLTVYHARRPMAGVVSVD